MRRCIRIGFILLGMLVAANAATAAGPPAVDPLAGKVQERYDSLTSLQGEFKQILTHKESGAREQRSGVLYFKKPLLVRWETRTPVKELLVVTPQAVWHVFPDEDLAYKYPANLADDSQSLVRVITGQARLEQDFYLENKGEDDGLTRLQAYPKEPTQALTEAVFWVDLSTNLIKRFRIIDFYGNENEISFVTQDVNAAIADSVFTFTPAKGMKVEDRSKDGAGAARKPLLQ